MFVGDGGGGGRGKGGNGSRGKGGKLRKHGRGGRGTNENGGGSAAAAGGDGSSAKATEGSTPEERCYRCGKRGIGRRTARRSDAAVATDGGTLLIPSSKEEAVLAVSIDDGK